MTSAPAESLRELPAPSDPPAEMPPIDRHRNGYNPGQVHQWGNALLGRIRELEGELARVVGHAGHSLVHDASSPQGKAMLADVLKLASDEITGQQAAAAAEVAQMLRQATEDVAAKHADATRQCGDMLSRAEAEAGKLVAGAREQADTVLQTAHGQAKDITDRASAHAAAVHEGAQRRLGYLVSTHTETRRRMQEIHDVTGKLLDQDAERGDLEAEVAKITSGALDQPPAEGTVPLPPNVNPNLTLAIAHAEEAPADKG